jgi:hypothetical protein
MQEKNLTALDRAADPGDDLLANLSPQQLEEIRLSVLEGIAEIERGEYTEYVGRAGLKQLTADVKARGRERLRAKGIIVE